MKKIKLVRFLLPVCRFCWFLYPFNIHLYMHIFCCIFLSNYWWQKSDIWSQASYRYPISWEAFLDPSDSYLYDVHHWLDTNKTVIKFSKYFASHMRIVWKIMDVIPKWFSIYIHRTIIHTNIKMFVLFLSKGEGGILFYFCPSFRPSKIFFVAFFSVTVDGRNLIFGHKRHIGIPYCG
jgi:hypothetical protein